MLILRETNLRDQGLEGRAIQIVIVWSKFKSSLNDTSLLSFLSFSVGPLKKAVRVLVKDRQEMNGIVCGAEFFG